MRIILISLLTLIIMIVRMFLFKINKPRRGNVNKNIQLVPSSIGVVSKFIFLCFLVMLFFVFLFWGSNKPNDRKGLIVSSVLSSLFLFIWLFYQLIKYYTYEENTKFFVISNKFKEVKINYEDIEKFYISYNYIVVIDKNNKKAKINCVWFRPRILINSLKQLIEDGKFDYLGELKLDKLLSSLEFIESKYR